MTDWRVELAAARVPPGPDALAWDRLWVGRFDRYVTGGKTPNEAIRAADRLTAEQHGPRPESQQGAQT